MKKSICLFLILFVGVIANSLDKKLDFTKSDSSNDTKNIVLTIDDTVALALKNNLGVETEKLKLEQKRWAQYSSWNVFIPTMNFTTSMVRTNDRDPIKVEGSIPLRQITNPMSEGFPGYTVMPYSKEISKPEFTPTFGFDLSWYLNAQVGFAAYSTVLDYRSGEINLEIAEKKLTKDVKKNFYSLILLKENIKLMEDNIAAAQNRYKQAQINFKNVLIPEFNLLQAQVAFENLKPTLLEMKNNLDIAKLSLKQMVGMNSNVNITLDGSLKITDELKEFDGEKLIKKYIDNRLDVQSMNMTLKSLKNLKNIYISALTPSFMLRLTVDPTFQANIGDSETWKYSTGDKKGEVMSLEDLWKQKGGMLMFTISLPIDPLIPFSKKQMDIVNTNFNIKQSEVGLRQLKLGAELEIQSLVMKIRKSKSSIETLKLNIALADKAYKWQKSV